MRSSSHLFFNLSLFATAIKQCSRPGGGYSFCLIIDTVVRPPDAWLVYFKARAVFMLQLLSAVAFQNLLVELVKIRICLIGRITPSTVAQ